jgi:hypothetical protein
VLEWQSNHPGRLFLHSHRPAIYGPGTATTHPPARVLFSRAARMASKGLRVAFEGSSMGAWERTVKTVQATTWTG